LSYVEDNLIAGEKAIYQTRLHWVVLLGPVVLGLLFGIPGLVFLVGAVVTIGDKSEAASGLGIMGLVALVIAATSIGLGIWQRAATEMAVTNKRVIIKTGLVSRKTVELLLGRVESIGVNESVLGRMLGYGTVVVRGTGGTPEPFDKVAHPLEFRRQVQQQIERSQEQRGEAVARAQ